MSPSRQSTPAQRELTQLYEDIRDELPETPAHVWRAWLRQGRMLRHNTLLDRKNIE